MHCAATISVTFTSAAGSLFAKLYSGHTGVGPYTTAVSDTYQDVFGEGIFTGKVLHDVEAFNGALEDGSRASAYAESLLSTFLYEEVCVRRSYRMSIGTRSLLELVDVATKE